MVAASTARASCRLPRCPASAILFAASTVRALELIVLCVLYCVPRSGQPPRLRCREKSWSCRWCIPRQDISCDGANLKSKFCASGQGIVSRLHGRGAGVRLLAVKGNCVTLDALCAEYRAKRKAHALKKPGPARCAAPDIQPRSALHLASPMESMETPHRASASSSRTPAASVRPRS